MDGTGDTESRSKKTSISFISSIFRRTISFSESTANETESLETTRSRQRSTSESIVDDFHMDDIESSKDFNDIETSRRRSNSSVDECNLSSSESNLRTSFNLSRILMGSRSNQAISATSVGASQSSTSQEASELQAESSNDRGISAVDNDSNSSLQPSLLLSENVSQNDHINSRLLGAFLSRINNVAASLVDPTGKGDTGLVYTDDPVMDRILKRTEGLKDN